NESAPDSIGFEASLSGYSGHYLFAVERPALLDVDPVGFTEQVLQQIRSETNNRVVYWLQSANPLKMGALDNYGFPFFFLLNVYQTTSDLNFNLGSNASFYIVADSRLQIDTDSGALRIFASATSPKPFIGFLG